MRRVRGEGARAYLGRSVAVSSHRLPAWQQAGKRRQKSAEAVVGRADARRAEQFVIKVIRRLEVRGAAEVARIHA